MAKIKAVCPFCGEENRYDATAAGLHVSCPDCGGRFQLDYADRPQRGCLGSCLTGLLTLLILGAVAAGLAYYFNVSLPWPGFDIRWVGEEAERVEDDTPQAPPAAPSNEPSPQAESAKEQEPVAPPTQASIPTPTPPQPTYALRTWVDVSGAFNVTAKLVDFDEGRVRLEQEMGETIEVPVDRLSQIDRNYLFEVLGEEFEPEFRRLVGTVVDVISGDKFSLRTDSGAIYEVRLAGVDAPEPGQEYAEQARDALAALIRGETITVKCRDHETQGEILGIALVDSRSVNLAMLNQGWAWYDDRTLSDPEFRATEQLARDLRRGLWAGENPQPPWEFRGE